MRSNSLMTLNKLFSGILPENMLMGSSLIMKSLLVHRCVSLARRDRGRPLAGEVVAMTSSLVLLHVDAVQKGIIGRDKKSEQATAQDRFGCQLSFLLRSISSQWLKGDKGYQYPASPAFNMAAKSAVRRT